MALSDTIKNFFRPPTSASLGCFYDGQTLFLLTIKMQAEVWHVAPWEKIPLGPDAAFDDVVEALEIYCLKKNISLPAGLVLPEEYLVSTYTEFQPEMLKNLRESAYYEIAALEHFDDDAFNVICLHLQENMYWLGAIHKERLADMVTAFKNTKCKLKAITGYNPMGEICMENGNGAAFTIMG